MPKLEEEDGVGDGVKSLSEIKKNLVSGKATLAVTDDTGEGDKQLRNRSDSLENQIGADKGHPVQSR